MCKAPPRQDDWPPFQRQDLLLTQTREHVDAFLAGQFPRCESNGLIWAEQLADSAQDTNASLHWPIDPFHSQRVAFGQTNGFDHARFDASCGFFAFRQQVIAAAEPIRERAVGAT